MISKANIPEIYETSANELKGSELELDKVVTLLIKLSDSVNSYEFHSLVNELLRT